MGVLQYFCCCKWTLWVGSGWNWCMYPLLVSSQISLISMVFSCLCCCHINKGKFAMLPLFNRLEVLHSASDKPKLIANNLSRNSYLDDAGCSLPVFHCRTNLKQHIISVNPKMVTTNVDSPKVWSWFSCILAELFNMCLKESCFPDCWNVSLVVPISNKNYHHVIFLSVFSKVFENL